MPILVLIPLLLLGAVLATSWVAIMMALKFPRFRAYLRDEFGL